MKTSQPARRPTAILVTHTLALVLALVVGWQTVRAQTPSTWTNTSAATASWQTGTNWNNGVPSGVGAAASVIADITAPQTITLDGAVTLGSLTIGDPTASGASAYTLTSGTYASGTATLSGTLTFDVSSGSASLNQTSTSGSNVIAANVVLADPLTITNNTASAPLTLSGSVSGAAGFTKAGAGVLTLTGASTFAGGVNLSSGSIRVGNNAALGTGTATIGNSTTLTANSTASRTLPNALSLSGSFTLGDATNSGVLNFTGAATLTGATQITNPSYVSMSGAIGETGGARSLTKTGAGTLLLGASNSFTGGTTISNGSLELGGSERLADTGNVLITGGTFDLAGFTETINQFSATAAASVTAGTLNAAGGYSFSNASSTVTVAAALGGGTAALTKSGAGTVVLTGASSFNGGSTITGGAVQVGNNSALGTGAVSLTGATLQSDSATARTLANPLTVGGSVTLGASNTGALTFSSTAPASLSDNTTLTASVAVTLSGGLSGTAGRSLTKAGSGVLTLAGPSSVAGGITINAGGLTVGTGGSLASDVTVNGGGTLTNAVAGGVTGNIALNNNATFTVTNSTTTGAITVTGTGGTIGGTGGLSATSIDATVAAGGTASFSATLAGSGSFTKSGAGTAVMSGANAAYAGRVTLAEGLMQYTANNVTGTGTLSLVSGTLASNSTTGRTLGNTLVSFDGDVTIGGTGNTGATTFSGSGALTGDRTLTLLSDATLTGGISGAYGFTKSGTSTLTINGANTFTGTTRVVSGTLVLAAASPGKTGVTNLDGGALRLGNDAALGGASGDTLVLTSGAVSSNSGAARAIANPVTLAGNVTVGGGGTGPVTFSGSTTLTGNRTLSIAVSTTISGPINDGGNGYRLTKSGNSALTLSGSNSYTGGTTINSGQLTFTSTAALGSGTVSINGGTLVASGPYLPVSAWLNSGRIAPGPNGGIALIGNSTEAIDFSAYPNLSLASASNAIYSGTAFTPYTDGAGARIFRLGGGAGVLTFSSTIANGGTNPTQVWIRGDTSGGAVVLGGSNSYTGGLYLDSGVLQVSNDNQLANITGSGSNAISFIGGTLRYSGTATDYSAKFAMPTSGNQIAIDTGSQNVSFATVLTGAGGLSKVGSGTLAATAAYAGATNVSGGILALTLSSTATPPTGGMTASSGTLRVLTTNDRTLASTLSVSGGGVQLSPADGTTLTFSGTLNRFIVTGTPGPLTVTSGRVLFTGTVTSIPDADWNVSGGVLELANPLSDQNDTVNVLAGGTTRLGASDQILTSGTINGAFDLNGFSDTLATLAGSGTVTNSAASASTLALTAASTIPARLTDSQAGAGTLALVISPTSSTAVFAISNPANDYRGGTTMQGGVMTLGADNVLGSGGLTMTAGTLRSDTATGRAYSGSLTVAGTVSLGSTTAGQTGPLALSGPVVLSGGTRSITVNSDVTITGTISDGGAGNGLTKAGSGLLVLAGTNTYSGLTNITGGTVRMTGSNSSAGATTLATAVLQLGRDNPLASGTLTLTSGTLSSDSGTARTLTNPLLFGGNVTLGDATNSGALTLAGSGSGTAMRTLTVPGAVQLTGSLTGALGITKSGAGVLTITSTANNYTGGTTLNAGRIRAGSNSALGGAAGTVTLFSGALSSDGTTPRSLANNFSVTGNVTLGDATDSGALTLTGNTILTGNRTVTFASDVTLTGVLGEQGPGRVLTKDGPGTFTLASPVSYTGGTVLNAGRIRVGVASALGTATTTLNGGSLSSDGSTPRTIGNPVSYGGNVTLGNASDAGVLTFSGTQTLTGNREITVASDVVMSSRIADGGSGFGFTKSGTGTLTLTGTSTFSGTLSVNAGTVFVAAGGVVAPAGRVDVNAGAILAGSGTVGGLTVNNAGTLTPGTGPAQIAAASGILQPMGNYNWQILNATGTAGQANGWDVLAITGTGVLDLSSLSAASSATRFNLNTWTLSGTNPDVDGPALNFALTSTSSYRFQFATFADATRLLLPSGLGSASPDQDLTTLFNLNTSPVNGTGGWDASQRPGLGVMSVRVGLDGKSLDLVIVPEPSAACLVALGAIAMGIWRRRAARRG